MGTGKCCPDDWFVSSHKTEVGKESWELEVLSRRLVCKQPQDRGWKGIMGTGKCCPDDWFVSSHKTEVGK